MAQYLSFLFAPVPFARAFPKSGLEWNRLDALGGGGPLTKPLRTTVRVGHGRRFAKPVSVGFGDFDYY